MSGLNGEIKSWLNANVWDGEDRSGCESDYIQINPDDLLELVTDCVNDVTAKEIQQLQAQLDLYKESIHGIRADLTCRKPAHDIIDTIGKHLANPNPWRLKDQ